ncbi:MAG: DUF2165 domain-containing protein [Marinibacterium sp.]|nr:DUF2165 domain-containing protein [Marinibacterium sp.]
MLDTAIALAQIVALAGPTAWLATGVWDNICHPGNNETFTAEVLSMSRMRDAYPEQFAPVAHRAITNRKVQKTMFAVAVVSECLALLMMLAGLVALCLSFLGWMPNDTARGIAILGATMFTSIWMGFLVLGNYFCYWFCHEFGQQTHYMMLLWGFLLILFLTV